jgi:hypothetical protein
MKSLADLSSARLFCYWRDYLSGYPVNRIHLVRRLADQFKFCQGFAQGVFGGGGELAFGVIGFDVRAGVVDEDVGVALGFPVVDDAGWSLLIIKIVREVGVDNIRLDEAGERVGAGFKEVVETCVLR